LRFHDVTWGIKCIDTDIKLSILWNIIEFLKAGIARPKGPLAYAKRTLKSRSL